MIKSITEQLKKDLQKYESIPERDEIPEPLNEQLVVELYSK